MRTSSSQLSPDKTLYERKGREERRRRRSASSFPNCVSPICLTKKHLHFLDSLRKEEDDGRELSCIDGCVCVYVCMCAWMDGWMDASQCNSIIVCVANNKEKMCEGGGGGRDVCICVVMERRKEVRVFFSFFLLDGRRLLLSLLISQWRCCLSPLP
jgi:hypothetical protein